MTTVVTILGQKPIIGVVGGLGGFLSTIVLRDTLGYIALIFGVGISLLTFLIKFKEAGGLSGIWKIIKNWKKE